MNILYKPNCLTVFFKYPQYEIYCLDEEYESNGLMHTRNTELDEADEEIYEMLMKDSLLSEPIEDEDGDVYCEYKENVPKFVRVNEKDVERVLVSEETDFYSAYDPLEDAPNLYTELAKIKYFDIPSLKKFIEHFGLPVGKDFFETDIYTVFNYEMDLFSFYNTLFYYKKALGVYEALQINDEDKINEYAQEFYEYVVEELGRGLTESTHTIMDFKQDKISEKLKQMEETNDPSDWGSKYHQVFKEEASKIAHAPYIVTKWYEIENEPPVVKAWHYLSELLTNWEKGSDAFPVIDGQIKPGKTFNDLIEVAYFQLSRTVIGNVKMNRCEYCGALFEVTHESRRFCPPLPKNKISTCQNNFGQKIKRKRRKAKELYAAGLSVEEIAKKLKVDIRDIQSYLND